MNEGEDGFDVVVWSDESSIQMETQTALLSQAGFSPKNKPSYYDDGESDCLAYEYSHLYRPKHSPKVHVWAGISPTPNRIFDGNIDGGLYADIAMLKNDYSSLTS